ncbi:bifunctional 4-hydroxy-2-oxoglutarate aldolase/2-dehydro-3-deoxy-phosphogluconate aldolase [Arthrobacter sp. H14-L1]|uniref:bifunctional 4-hydroxy-2-oxoglutarate aldolase/2-dehydro-3-deoxy-phosphogluconate aldolase n=1 Tax=Arthrobacter sp. H14-L1 TaxID=2996697 RepID=UPI0022707ED3|nr:bifunctional 4-hydroxy-2-oxoglutarate aldolase/2-dehydro-3-deoxy-phosphogluconate aldolase [Arthrobacter sp. H14-L1]MCY0906095.1 bifunctional 4-hydroxy-2-oxoglutarate aldolase/2-dehydro-3-deoxy-phosphogluconate aldolase [Arthrobacter sp. H14-L1]
MTITAAQSNDWFSNNFEAAPIMAILRGFGVLRSLELATIAWDLGITSVEVPIQSPDDIETLTAIASAGADRGLHVGAGTVLTPNHVRQAAEAGAAFTVSPGLDPDIVAASLATGMPTLPGIASSSEIQCALRQGLSWVKAFPATALGTTWFKAQHGPFPQLNIVATGGLDAANLRDYLGAGARVGAVGSALADESQLSRLAAIIAG